MTPNKPESARCLTCKEFCAGTYREQSKVGEHDRKEDSREDTRSIDKLVRDIEGTQEKKKKKRQRTKVKKVENLKDGVKIGKPSYDVDKIEKENRKTGKRKRKIGIKATTIGKK